MSDHNVKSYSWIRKLYFPPGLRVETPVVLLLFALAMAIGMAYVQSRPGLPFFYQYRFGPAIAIAAGEGFQDVTGPAAVRQFLNRQTDAVTPEDLRNLELRAPARFHVSHYYLLTAVGHFWRKFGVSWEALSPLFGILYAISICAMYGLFRLMAPRWLALSAVAILFLSAIHLTMLPSLRDYAKAPILLPGLFFLALLVRVALPRWGIIAVAVLLGLLVGVGGGFRFDAILIAPAFFTVLFLFMPHGPTRALKTKLFALLIFLAIVWIGRLPIPEPADSEIHPATFHIIAMGFAANLYPQLGLDPSLYDHEYKIVSDFAQWAIISDYNERRTGMDEIAYRGPDYQKAAINYVAALARHLPADVLVRAYASARTIIDELAYGEILPFGSAADHVRHPFLTWLYDLRANLAAALRGTGVFWFVGALLVLGMANLRWLLAFLFLFAYFAATAILQFHVRHFFHLEVFAWWSVLVVLISLGHLARRFWAARSTEEGAPFPFRRLAWLAAVVVACFAAGWTALYVARVYQQTHLTKLFADQYLDLPLAPLQTKRLKSQQGSRELLTFPQLAPETKESGEQWTETRYLVIDLDHPTSESERTIAFTARYESPVPEKFFQPLHDLSREFRIRLPRTREPATTRLFLPAYYFHVNNRNAGRFVGIETDAATAPYLTHTYEARELERIPFTMTLILPPNWRQWPLYERFTDWQGPRLFRPVGDFAVPFHSPNRTLIPPTF